MFSSRFRLNKIIYILGLTKTYLPTYRQIKIKRYLSRYRYSSQVLFLVKTKTKYVIMIAREIKYLK